MMGSIREHYNFDLSRLMKLKSIKQQAKQPLQPNLHDIEGCMYTYHACSTVTHIGGNDYNNNHYIYRLS